MYLQQRPDDALHVLEQVEPRLPNDERVIYLLARVYLRKLSQEKAIGLLEEVTRHYPRRLGALRLLASAYAADFRIDAARDTLRKLLDLDVTPEQRGALRAELLNLHVEFGDFNAALDLVERWISD